MYFLGNKLNLEFQSNPFLSVQSQAYKTVYVEKNEDEKEIIVISNTLCFYYKKIQTADSCSRVDAGDGAKFE